MAGDITNATEVCDICLGQTEGNSEAKPAPATRWVVQSPADSSHSQTGASPSSNAYRKGGRAEIKADLNILSRIFVIYT